MSEDITPTEIVQSEAPVEVVESTETEQVEQDAQADEQEADEPRKPRGVQKRIDELTGNWRNAERERDHWREVAMRTISAPEPVYDDQAYYQEPEIAQPLSPQSLLEQAKELLRQEQQQQAIGEKAAKFKASVSDPETQEFLNSPYAPITTEMADIMLEHEAGAQIATWLARNQSEAARIAQLPPHKQALALITAASTTPAPKRMTSAPAPVQRLAGKGAAAPSPDNMSMAEYVAWRNQRA
jgi:hypothetical protein